MYRGDVEQLEMNICNCIIYQPNESLMTPAKGNAIIVPAWEPISKVFFFNFKLLLIGAIFCLRPTVLMERGTVLS